MPHWPAVGPDFTARMTGAPEPVASNVVALRPDAPSLPDPDDTGWSAAAARLHDQDPAIFAAWFAALVAVDFESGTLTLSAKSRFVADYVTTHHMTRLLAAVSAENSGVRDISIIVA